MLNKEFQGVLSKLQEKGGEDAHTQLAIKHVSQEPTFFESLNSIFKKENISGAVDTSNKVKLSLSVSLDVTVEFDEVEFDAKLIEVKLTKKEKKGEVSFECEMRLEKEIDDSNKLLGVNYLNHKEENGEGKMKLVLYPVTVTKKVDA